MGKRDGLHVSYHFEADKLPPLMFTGNVVRLNTVPAKRRRAKSSSGADAKDLTNISRDLARSLACARDDRA